MAFVVIYISIQMLSMHIDYKCGGESRRTQRKIYATMKRERDTQTHDLLYIYLF